MSICHNINIIVQTTGGDAYSINVKSEISNKTLSNVTRDFQLIQVTIKKFDAFPISM